MASSAVENQDPVAPAQSPPGPSVDSREELCKRPMFEARLSNDELLSDFLRHISGIAKLKELDVAFSEHGMIFLTQAEDDSAFLQLLLTRPMFKSLKCSRASTILLNPRVVYQALQKSRQGGDRDERTSSSTDQVSVVVMCHRTAQGSVIANVEFVRKHCISNGFSAVFASPRFRNFTPSPPEWRSGSIETADFKQLANASCSPRDLVGCFVVSTGDEKTQAKINKKTTAKKKIDAAFTHSKGDDGTSFEFLTRHEHIRIAALGIPLAKEVLISKHEPTGFARFEFRNQDSGARFIYVAKTIE